MPGVRSIVAAGVATLALTAASGAADGPPSWTTFGGSAARTGLAADSASVAQLTRRFVIPLSGGITAQVLEVNGTFVAATTGGDVVAFDANGFVHWHDHLGQLAHTCQQLNGYGVVGTGAIDPSAGTYYVADAFGRLHALSLATGIERAGWPIRVFSDFDRELDWGALTLAAGAVYIPTAAYCDQPGTPGGIYRVDLASRAVTHWLAVPLDEGGGGGPWGWGGLAYDPTAGLFAGTSGAFSAGSNVGSSFTETAGNGDRLVQFSTGLAIKTSSHPAGLPDGQDLDFVGSPLLVGNTTSCGPLVVAATKNDTVYGWHENNLAAGWAWKVPIEPYAANDPFVSQLAWSDSTSSIYAVTGTELVRIAIDANCTATVAWRRLLGTHAENGSPTVAGKVVWFANNGTQQLVGYDTTSGARVQAVPLGGTTLEAPTIVGGRLVVGTFDGIVEGFRPAGPHRQRSSHARALCGRPRRSAGRAARTASTRQATAGSSGLGSTRIPHLPSCRSRHRAAFFRPDSLRANACAQRASCGRLTADARGMTRRRSGAHLPAAAATSTSGSTARCACSGRCRPPRPELACRRTSSRPQRTARSSARHRSPAGSPPSSRTVSPGRAGTTRRA